MEKVTWNGWGVSTMTYYPLKGEKPCRGCKPKHKPFNLNEETERVSNGVILNVYKKGRKGDHDGKWFQTSKEAFDFAFERGYLQRFVHAWCRRCRVLHTFLGHKSGFCSRWKEFT